MLGSGSFATVKKATSRKDGSEWAVKIIDKAKLQREDEEALKVEVAILEQVRRGNLPPVSSGWARVSAWQGPVPCHPHTTASLALRSLRRVA